VTPEQRRLRARVAANARWSRYMAREDQAYAARTAIFARLEREVDPDNRLSPDQRAMLVKNAARSLSARLNAAKARKRARLLRGRTALHVSRRPLNVAECYAPVAVSILHHRS
jgi:hypothetical protein